MRCLAAVLVLALPALAHADYRPGIVPEGTTGYMHGRHDLHLSLFGTSEVAVTAHTEIGTYLLADAILFPNLRIKHQIDASETSAVAWILSAGAGVLPMAVGAIMPLPGGVVAGGGVGFAWGAIQSATLVGTMRSPEHALAVSINAGGFIMEGGIVAAAVAVGAGGSGAGGGAGAGEDHGSRKGATVGIELDRTLGAHDALTFAADVWAWQRLTMDTSNGFVYPKVTWSHQFTHWQLSTGAYALIDLPKGNALHSKMPVAPYINVAYNR